MKVTLKKMVKTKFFDIEPTKVFEADKLENGRYLIHLDKVVSVMVDKKNIIEVDRKVMDITGC